MRHILLIVAFLLPLMGWGQGYLDRINERVEFGDTTQLHQLILIDYSRLLGTARRVEGDTLYFRLSAAVEDSPIPTRELRYLGTMASNGRRVVSAAGPGFTDLTYERTALPFQSRIELKTIMLIYTGVEVNLNEHFQIGAGLGGLLGVLLTARVRTSITPRVHVALSNQSLFSPIIGALDGGNAPLVGDVSALLTLGDDKRFLNLGYGYFYNTDRFAEGDRVFLSRMGLGGRVGKKWHLYTEALVSLNRTFRQTELYPSLNAAYANRRHRWKFGVMSVVFDLESFLPPPIPYVGYSLYW